MCGMTTLGIWLTLLATIIFTPAKANFVVVDTWGLRYCRSSYCGIMDADGWARCCERYRKCCAYAEYTHGRSQDPFAFDISFEMAPRTLPPTTTPTTTTPLPKTADKSTEYFVESLGDLPPILLETHGRLPGGRPENLRLQSAPQRKPIPGETSGQSNSNRPWKPNKNDVTYELPPLPQNIQEMRMEEHERESCRAKFCGIMSSSQWYDCCSRYKNCCAYVSYLHLQSQDPFHFERGPNDS